MKDMEKRSLPASSVETREEGGSRHIAGVIPYDSMSEDMGWREVIRKGAFTKTLLEGDPRCLWAHNTQYVLGRKSAGTLTFEDRDDGLHFDCAIPDTSWAADVFKTIARRDAPGVSFGFRVIKDAWTHTNGSDPSIRELLEVQLIEVSVGVAFPAYPAGDSSSSTRALFEGAGINMERLAAVLSCAEGRSDYKAEGRDLETLKGAVEALSKLMPEEREAPDVQKTEPEESTRGKPEKSTYNARRRELELLEASAAEI